MVASKIPFNVNHVMSCFDQKHSTRNLTDIDRRVIEHIRKSTPELFLRYIEQTYLPANPSMSAMVKCLELLKGSEGVLKFCLEKFSLVISAQLNIDDLWNRVFEEGTTPSQKKELALQNISQRLSEIRNLEEPLEQVAQLSQMASELEENLTENGKLYVRKILRDIQLESKAYQAGGLLLMHLNDSHLARLSFDKGFLKLNLFCLFINIYVIASAWILFNFERIERCYYYLTTGQYHRLWQYRDRFSVERQHFFKDAMIMLVLLPSLITTVYLSTFMFVDMSRKALQLGQRLLKKCHLLKDPTSIFFNHINRAVQEIEDARIRHFDPQELSRLFKASVLESIQSRI